MHRLYALINGRLADLTHADDSTAAQALAQAAAVFVCGPRPEDTVAHYPARDGRPDRWLRGGRPVAEEDLPSEWELPGGRRIRRPGDGRDGSILPRDPRDRNGNTGNGGNGEVRAWRLSTNRT